MMTEVDKTEPQGICFDERINRFSSDLRQAFQALYGDRPDFESWYSRLTDLTRDAFEKRPMELKTLDAQRERAGSDWFQKENMLGYMCYPDRFADDFDGVAAKIPYLQDLGVTYLHLLSVLKAREGDSDGGFAIEDYLQTNENLGSIGDLETLVGELRKAGISLCLDFVFNHTAKEHEWARRAIAGDKVFQEYYFMFADRTVPEQYEEMLEQVFPVTAPGNFTYVEACEKWVWTTFYPYQWDLNYHNPAVLLAMLQNLFDLANKGVEIFRFDAAIYAWKELGTHCRNLPQTHALLQVFRAAAAIVAPGIALKAEAMAGARHITKYFGFEEQAGKECQLAYHNAAMAAMWDMLATGKVDASTTMLQALPLKPPGTSWIFYARCHDDIGWGGLKDSNGASWGATDEHLNYLWRFYAGQVPESFARGERFQPVAGEAFAGSNGSLASLAGLEASLERVDEVGVDLAVRRIILMHAVPMALDGIPLIYMGDEIALLNDYNYATDPAHQDGRWLHRPIMPQGMDGFEGKKKAAMQRIYEAIRSLVTVRKSLPVLGGKNEISYLSSGNEQVFAVKRWSGAERFLCLANFSAEPQSVDPAFVEEILRGAAKDMLSKSSDDLAATTLMPYQCRWLLKE